MQRAGRATQPGCIHLFFNFKTKISVSYRGGKIVLLLNSADNLGLQLIFRDLLKLLNLEIFAMV